MAQDFRNNLQRNVGTSEVTLVTGGDYDAVIGIRCCNVTTSTIEVDVFIDNSGNDHFIAKGVVVPPNSAIELIQGGAKIVLENNDLLKAKSNTASSLDIVTSFIDSISTKGGNMTAIINGVQYIGGQTSPDEFIKNQASTIDGTQTIDSAVLAGPITIPATITVTGTLVIV